MNIKFIFDVDGTLTPSRGVIASDFLEWLLEFADNHDLYIVTGSDRPKTLEQIGPDLYNKCKKVYQCSGNDVWIGDDNIRTTESKYPLDFRESLYNILNESKYYRKTGKHIEYRPGLCNFSIVGRNATLEDRAMYKQWDEHKKERENIVFTLNQKYGKIFDIKVAGETGIDIVQKGYDKAQIAHDFGPYDKLIFFGDKMNPDGNDYTLALEIIRSGGDAHHIRDWNDTWKILKAYNK